MATMQEITAGMSGFPREVPWTSFGPQSGSGAEAFTSAFYSLTHGRTQIVRGEYRRVGTRVAITLGPKSWATTAARSSEDLRRHEQGHYDITGLVGRDILMGIIDLSWSEAVVEAIKDSGDNKQTWMRWADQKISADAKKIIDAGNALLAVLQSTPARDGIYDTDTNHSQNTTGQNAWNTRFQRMKASTDNFGLMLKLEGVV